LFIPSLIQIHGPYPKVGNRYLINSVATATALC